MVNTQNSDKHKFLHDAGMTYQDVYNFAYKEELIPLLQSLASKIGEDTLIAMLKEATAPLAAENGQKEASQAQGNDLAAFTAPSREPNALFAHALTYEIVEDTETAHEIRVTECLWAKTFREAGAAAIGYAVVCHGDYAECQAFNPHIRMIRTKTLMQGDDCCNHRWVWQDD